MLGDLEELRDGPLFGSLNLMLRNMYLECRNKNLDYFVSNEKLQILNGMNDLSITVDKTLHFYAYIDSIFARAYRMCSTILSGFYTIFANFLISMYKTYVTPILEYNTAIWFPSCLT